MKKILIPFLLVLFSIPAYSEVITAAQDPWPPFVNEGGNPGISVELVAAAFKSQGYQLDMKLMPWKRAMSEVKEANIDVLIAVWHTKDRAKSMTFSEPYASNKLKFITRADDSFEYKGLDSLKGKSVGVARGYGYGDDFVSSTHFQRPEANDLVANLKKLSAKRIDMTLDDEIVAKAQISANGLDVNRFRFTKNALSENALHVSSSKSNSQGKRFIEAFNKGLTEIKRNGTYKKIMAKYGVK